MLVSEPIICGKNCGCGDICALTGNAVPKPVVVSNKLDDYQENENISAEYSETFNVG
jgi:hypothetical protein